MTHDSGVTTERHLATVRGGRRLLRNARPIDRRLPRIRIEGHGAEEDALDAELSRDDAPFPDPAAHRG